jgi:hypothetical protein
MQQPNNSAQLAKDSDKPPVYRNWRHRKADIARRQQAAEEAIARQNQGMRWRQDLIDDYTKALGGKVSAIQMNDIERVADLTLLALNARRAALRGDPAAISNLSRLESTCDRAVRRLGLPAPGSAAPVMDLHDHAAKRALERANPQPTAEEAD